ncbi:MAG TPA: hypothetical protein PLE71_15565, partial [Flavobacteriales bacterium]|nr:hypothetical protein [Flavobacteriales bacterium]
MIGEPKKKGLDDLRREAGLTPKAQTPTGKNQSGTKSLDDLRAESAMEKSKADETPFTEAPAQGPNDQLSSASSTPLGTPLATSTVMPGPSGPVSPKVRKPLNPDDFASALDFGDKSIKSDATSVGRIWDNPLATSEAYGEQKKKDQERHLLQDRYDTEYSVLSPEGVTANLARAEQRKQQVLAQQEVLGAGVDRFNQAVQDLSIWEQKIKENSHTLDEESLQSEVAKFDEADKKLRREASLLELQSVFVAGVGERNEVDKNLLKKREYAIKAKMGNTAAGFVRALTDQVGSMAAGVVDFSSPATSNLTDQAIMDFLGVLPEGQKRLSENEFEDRVLPTVRNWLTSSTGIDRFVSKEYIDTKKEESLFHGGLYAVAEMIPSVALSMTGAGAPAMAGGFFLSSYDQLGQEMSDPIWDQVNPTEKEFMRVGISSVSAGLSTMGMQALAGKLPFVKNIWFNVAKKIAPGMSSGDIRLLIDGETKTWVANMSSKLIQGFGNEGFEEVLDFSQEEGFKAAYEKYKESEFGDKANDLFANVETMKEFANGALNSFIVGGIAGDIMGGSIAATSSIGARERLTRKEFSLFSSVLREGDLAKVFEVNAKASLDEGKMDQAEYDKFLRNIEVAKNAMDQIPRDMDIEPSRKAFELLLEKEKLSKLNKSLVGDKMNVIDEKLAALATSPTKDTGKEKPLEEKPLEEKPLEVKPLEVKPLEVKPLEVKPTEPTGNETKERSTLAETKEDGELHNTPEGSEVQNNAADIQGQSSVSNTKDVTSTEGGTDKSGPVNEVLQPPTQDQAPTDPSTEASSEVQTEEQPATPEPVSNKPGEGKGTKESPYITRSGKKYGNFEITRDPDTGKNTIKPRSKSKDTWSKLPDKLAAKEYRAHKKRLLQAMRDAEVEFSKSTGHPINPRTGDPIGDGKRKKAERVSYQKEVDRKAGELSTTDKGTFGIALAWLSDGNTKISPESVRAYLGWGAGRNEGANAKYRVTEEEKDSKWILAKEGKGINISALAHKMWEENLVDGETLPGYETTDFEEAIAAVITVYKNTDEAYSALDELVRDNSPLDVDEQVRAYYEAQMANVTEEDVTREDIERTDAYIDKLTEDELDKLWEEKNAFEAEAANVGTEQGDTVSVPDQQGSKRAETGKEGKVTAKIKGISTEAQKEIDEALGLSSTDNSGALAQKPTNTRTINTGKLRTDRVVAALKKLVPNLKIVAPKTNNGYAEATKDIGEGLESTWGIYDPRTNKLYLNPSSPDLRQTLFHEAAHPIIIALAKNKPELFSKFYDQVRTEKGGKYTKFGQQYSDLSEAAQMAEALAEFFGDVVSGRVPVSTKPDSLYQQFKDFLKDILAALGWDMRSIDLGKPTDVREFAAQMKKAFDKGIAIEGFAPLTGNKEAKVALQDDADRLVDGWYSRLDQAVAAKGNTQSGADWSKWMEARAKDGSLSTEEVKWTGLAEFLDGKNKVTSQEVRDFLKENRVKV